MRRLRPVQRLTQEELAARAELSMRYVGSIERGRVSASVTIVGRLAKALDVDPCDLKPPR
ncbi:XRE family transcriptional regulator [Mesorhizobium sp. M00.F.Ca.ET.217.01.1.1]|nr:MAG: XRE family transcriptional regulator [Mesorhizobium sp.]TGQ18994.1 XRE family transcriptional regulator [Mesorhizobium sp. M00.F.Ca.ET.217.01.1.1]TGV89887.1 XRE family transcriptional regulator [Mesorhizobium sp. M00.F.Ca.ET.158.01.1.1]